MYIQNIIIIVVTIILELFVGAIVFRTIKDRQERKENRMDRDNYTIVNSPKWIFVLLTTSAVLGAVLILLNIFDGFETLVQFWGINISISIFIVLFTVGSFFVTKEKIEVNGNNIVITTITGKRKEFTFDDIAYIMKLSKELCLIYGAQKRLGSIDLNLAGAGFFMETIVEKGIGVL